MSDIAALIVSGGSGSRAGGGLAKQYRPLAGRAMIRRAIDVFSQCADALQVVIGKGHEAEYCEALAGLHLSAPVIGGDTRQESVRQGLEALAKLEPKFVLIHDAARPLVSRMLVDSVVRALESGADAVVPLLPIADSLRRIHVCGGSEAVPRECVCRVQTPQGFRFGAIRAAHEHFAGRHASDDIALAELGGIKVDAIPGEESNIKITTAADFGFAERLLVGATETRTGFGFDVHRFADGDGIWLCGAQIPCDRGLEGHSDADAGLHALTDALFGALAQGDIGEHFPPNDERWRGAPSRLFLEHAVNLMREANGAIANCDVTIICESPKVGPHREAMRSAIAAILSIEVSRVSVKATTTERLGFAGRGEGLAAQAVATIRLPQF